MRQSHYLSLTLALVALGAALGVGLDPAASQRREGVVITCDGCGDYRETPEQAERRRRSEQLFKQQVDAEVARLGEHRRAEAERLVRMREAAAAARPKQLAPTQSAQQEAGQCSERRILANQSFSSQLSEADARSRAQAYSNRECPRGNLTCGGITCQRSAAAVPGGARQWAEKNVTGLVTYQCTLAATRMQRFCSGSRVSSE